MDANGAVLNLTGSDLAAGVNPGSLASLLFTTDFSGYVTLHFSQGDLSQASPIFDNVTISTVPLPAALPLLGLGLFSLVAAGRRRNKSFGGNVFGV